MKSNLRFKTLSTCCIIIGVLMLQGCGGQAILCQGVIADIPADQVNEIDSLNVTLITKQGEQKGKVPLTVDSSAQTAGFLIPTKLVKSLFPGTTLANGDTLSLDLEKNLNAVVRVSSYRKEDQGVLDSLVLSDINFDVLCDRVLRRWDTLGTRDELKFEMTYDLVRVAPYYITIGSPGPNDKNLSLPVQVDRPTIPLLCGYDPFNKYKPE